MVRGSEMPTEIWTTSAPGPPSTAPATQTEQATFGLRLVKQAELGMTRSSWLNYALRDDEAVYWVSIGQQGDFNCSSLPAGLGRNGEFERKFEEI